MEGKLHINWKAGIVSGVVAGALFLILALLLIPIFTGASPWALPRMISAMVMGQEVLMPTSFDLGIVTVAVIVHFVLSIIYAFIFAPIVGRMGLGPAMLAGAIGGIALYLVNFYAFTALFPWFVAARSWIALADHLIFGLVAALVYVEMISPHTHEKKPLSHFRERKV